MQEMNTNLCKTAEEGTTGQLTDLRDGKIYWVTKLKDNNCWMTQNLALDLSTEKPLTSELSDVSTDGYTPPADTQVGTITTFPSSSDLTFSFDPGEYVYTTPTTSNSCGSSSITSLSQCTSKGWQLATGLGKDSSDNEQAHYLAGNYYSYKVATAGYTSTGTAPYSICPKGWQLPTSNSTTASKSFDYLLTQYGVEKDLTNAIDGYDIRLAPLYFVYGGQIGSTSSNNTTTMVIVGVGGGYWSSTASGSTNAYYLSFSTSVNPSAASYNSRYYGHSVRCVAK